MCSYASTHLYQRFSPTIFYFKTIILFCPCPFWVIGLLGGGGGQPAVAFPENYSWVCLPLYVTLIGLAASGLSMEVTEALATAAASYPGTHNSCDEK